MVDDDDRPDASVRKEWQRIYDERFPDEGFVRELIKAEANALRSAAAEIVDVIPVIFQVATKNWLGAVRSFLKMDMERGARVATQEYDQLEQYIRENYREHPLFDGLLAENAYQHAQAIEFYHKARLDAKP